MPCRLRCRAVATWLAFVALASNLVLPAALSTIVGPTGTRGGALSVGFCRTGSGDVPGKTKPGLVVEHCSLCTVTAALLPRPPRFAVPAENAHENPRRLQAALSIALIRPGEMQARAPPSVG